MAISFHLPDLLVLNFTLNLIMYIKSGLYKTINVCN